MTVSRPLRLFFQVLAGSLLAAAHVASAALAWETTKVAKKAEAGAREVVVSFPFRNTGERSVSIRDISTTCECTVADLPKRDYAAGESGALTATFVIGDRMGTQERAITVQTDDPTAPLVTLTLQVDIPEPLTYSPRLLRWKIGEPARAQVVEVTAAGQRIAGLQADEGAAGANVSVETLEAGAKYRIRITPPRTDKFETVPVNFRVRFQDGNERSFVVYALVR